MLFFLAPPAASANEIYEYDALGRLIKVSYENGKDVGYCYDDAGNRRVVLSADNVATPLTDPACADPPPPAPPPEPFNGKIIIVPLNGFTVIPVPN